MKKLLLLTLLLIPASLSAETKDICEITGKVLLVDLGEFASPMPTAGGRIVSNKVQYTRLTIEVIESKTFEIAKKLWLAVVSLLKHIRRVKSAYVNIRLSRLVM